MKAICQLLVYTILLTSGYSQSGNKDYSEVFKLVEVWLEAQKDYEQLPGLTGIVIEDQKVIWTGAFGMSDVENQVQTQTSTLFSICSISKLFTSIAIMKLYDEGKLRLDDRLEDILPTFQLEQKYYGSGPITIRSLLTHSSGLPREADYPYWTGPYFPFPGKDQIDAKLGNQETLYPASTYLQYSNLGIVLLGDIIEQVSGVSYDEYIEKNILIPLGLTNTRTEMPEQLYGKELSVGYSAISRDLKREKVNFFKANGIAAAAGFSSNVVDLGKFAAWLIRLRDISETEILKSSTLKYMHNVHWTNPDWKLTWGLGFIVNRSSEGITWVGHDGSCPGYRTTLQIDLKNKRAFSIMINANGTNPDKYVNGINGILSKMKTTEKVDDQKEIKNLNEYAGHYNTMPWQSEVYFSTWYGNLVRISLPSEKPETTMTFYKHIEGDTFRRIRDDDELGETLVFERDANNKIIHYKSHSNYSTKINK